MLPIDSSVINSLRDLGIGLVGLTGSGVIVYIVLRKLFTFLDRQQNNVEEKEKWWTGYIEENNHATTEMIKEQTAINVEVKNALGTHNQLLERLLDRLPPR